MKDSSDIESMNRPKILIVEDNENELKALTLVLNREFQIETAANGETALNKLAQERFDLVILDLGLPGMDGYKFCANFRINPSTANTPIIILTGRFDIEDKIMSFSLGASDFITKPVDARELKARINVHINRQNKSPDTNIVFQVGPFEGDLRNRSIHFNTDEGKRTEIQMSTLEFKLLHFFLTHVDHVVSREQLLNKVWGSERNVNDRSVDVSISKLRAKLGPYGNLLQAVRGSGYRFLDPKNAKKNVA